MRVVLAAVAALWVSGAAKADCVCRCTDGEMQPLCNSSIDIPPICPATICPLAAPAMPPIEPPRLPPPGMSECAQHQVLDPRSGLYTWQTVCR